MKSKNIVPDGVCEDCAKDGNEYHAYKNKYPTGTVLRCTRCFHLFGMERNLIERTIIGMVLAATVVLLIHLYVLATSAELGKIL